MELKKLLFALACILTFSVMGTISSVDGAVDGMNCSAGSTVLDCEVGGHILLTEGTLHQQGNQDQTSSLDNGSHDTCSTSSSLLKSWASSCNGQEQCAIESIDELSDTCGDLSQLTLHYICLPGPVYNPCLSTQLTMTRSAGTAYVITPHYPFSYPRDSDSVQSSCTMEVLIPAGQTIEVTNYQSSLPTGTVLGVCGNSVHIALPKTVIESTYCTEMDEIMQFTSDFQIRFYGTWTDKANGAILQIKDGTLPTDQIASFTKCLRKDSQPTTTMSINSQFTTNSVVAKEDIESTTEMTTLEVDSGGEVSTDGSTTRSVPNTSKDSVSNPSTVTVQNPSPTRIFVPNTTLLETLPTETQDNALFEELSTPHNINIDTDANSLQSTGSEIVSFSTQSGSDDINDDVSEITTTHNSAILSDETIAQTVHDTTLEPLTQSSEEALSDVSKTVFTTLNPRTEEITDSSQADQARVSLDMSTIDPQSPQPETSTSIVSKSSTANPDHINITYQHNSTQNLVTETFQSTFKDIDYSGSSTDLQTAVASQDISTDGSGTTGAGYEQSEESTTLFHKTTETTDVATDKQFTIEAVITVNHPEQSETSQSGDSAATFSSSSVTSTISGFNDITTESGISGTSQTHTEVINIDGAKTTEKTDDVHVSAETTQRDHTESQSISRDPEDMESITKITTEQVQWSDVDGTTQETNSVPEVLDTSEPESTTLSTEQGTQNNASGGFSEETTVLPIGSVTKTMQTRNTIVEWSHNADINKTTTPTLQPANSTGAVTVPNGSVILGEKTSNVGIIIAGVLVGLVITFAIFNLCLVIIKLKRKNRRHCFFLRRDNNMNKKASKPDADSISKLGPYDAYNADNTANITNIMPPPTGEQDTAALIGLNIANGRVHSISIGGSNPRPSNGNVCHSSSDRAPTTSTFRPSEEEDLQSITRTIPNIHYISSNELFQPPDFVPFSNSRTNLVMQDRYSEIDENSLYSESSNDDSGYPKNSGSHVDQFLNSYPKSKDFYLSNSGTLYPRSKPQSPCGTNEPPPNNKPKEKIEKFPISHSVALPSTDETTKPHNNISHAGGQSTQHTLPNYYKFNIAQSTTETRV